jgi:hypothetical protein
MTGRQEYGLIAAIPTPFSVAPYGGQMVDSAAGIDGFCSLHRLPLYY